MMRTSVRYGVVVAMAIAAAAGTCGTVAHARGAGHRASTAVAPAQVVSGCTAASLSGSHGYAFTGVVLLPDGTRVDIAAVGVITYDGQGSFVGNDMASSGGTVRPRSFTGTYSVNPDCTGVGTIILPGSDIHTHFVVVAGGRAARYLVTDPGAVLVGESTRQ